MCRLRYTDISNLLFIKTNYIVGQIRKRKTPFTWRLIKNHRKISFSFAGLITIKLFNSLLEYTKDMVYYRETKRITSTKIKRVMKFSGTKDELLLGLMRRRLVLLKEDLVDRLCIAPIHCSNIFKTWIQLHSKTVGKLEVSLPKESVMESTQKIFKTDDLLQGKLQ